MGSLSAALRTWSDSLSENSHQSSDHCLVSRSHQLEAGHLNTENSALVHENSKGLGLTI